MSRSIPKAKFNYIQEITLKFDSYWYQNDEERQIVHRVDNSTVAYVMPEATFWVKLNETGSPIVRSCGE